MASAPSTKPAGGADRHYEEGRGRGLIVFASVVLAVVGFFNLIYGIAAVAGSHVFTANAQYVWGTLRWWGWSTLILGALQVAAAAGILMGNQFARWFGVAVVAISAVDQMFFLHAHPFWSVVIIAIDVVALWALCVYGGRENLLA